MGNSSCQVITRYKPEQRYCFMMNDEMNIHDEFEDWLKQSADKHRMYPSDKLWRNINGQLHEQPNWPALTFGAILTLALITATLIFLHPTKNVFTIPDYAYNSTSATVKKVTPIGANREIVETPRPTHQKELVYAFNSPFIASETETITLQNGQNQSSETLSPIVTVDNNTLPDVTMPGSTGSKLENYAQFAVKNTTNSNTEATTEVLHTTTTAEKTIIDEKSDQSVEEDPTLIAASARTVHLAQAKKKHWHIEVYGGSNISYRRLSESMIDNHATSTQSAATDRSNLNNVVSQKPSIGINAGAAFVYAVSDRLRVKAGIQLNFRQYNIDAYKSRFERSVLVLNNSLYYPDSVYTYSTISNEQGKAISLTNKYYQIGIPVGVEWTAVKLPNLHFNLGANIQPTYQINSNNYLLTSDYKSYVQAPGLLRRVNINAGLEATANFNAGKLQWQVGPQILYQTLPTQKTNYSIHEHLIDYGVRVGIIKQL